MLCYIITVATPINLSLSITSWTILIGVAIQKVMLPYNLIPIAW